MQHKGCGSLPRHSQVITQSLIKEGRMKLWIDLFSTDYGLMSLGVIVLILVMAVFFTRLFLGKMKNVATEPLK